MQHRQLQQTIERFEGRLGGSEGDSRTRIQSLLALAERELALISAAEDGLAVFGRGSPSEAARAHMAAWFAQVFGPSSQAAALISPEPGLPMVDVNAAYCAASGRTRDQLLGKFLFEAFPDNPQDPTAAGVAKVYASLRRVAQSGLDEMMEVQRYDVANAKGVFEERYWRQVNRALPDDANRLIYMLHVVEEFTDQVLGARGQTGQT